MTLTGNELLAFQAITGFVEAANEKFRVSQKSLSLYGRLIEKTTFKHAEAIQKHILAFRKFILANQEAFATRDHKKIKTSSVEYSPRVFINIAHLFRIADDETKNVIWSHLTTIHKILTDEKINVSKEKIIAEEKKKTEQVDESFSTPLGASLSDQVKGEGAEQDFLKNIINKVEGSIGESSTPQESMSNLMQSGALGELMTSMTSGMQDGSLDLGKMLGSLQTMIPKPPPGEGAPQPPNMPDMANMMGMMMQSMQGLQGLQANLQNNNNNSSN